MNLPIALNSIPHNKALDELSYESMPLILEIMIGFTGNVWGVCLQQLGILVNIIQNVY